MQCNCLDSILSLLLWFTSSVARVAKWNKTCNHRARIRLLQHCGQFRVNKIKKWNAYIREKPTQRENQKTYEKMLSLFISTKYHINFSTKFVWLDRYNAYRYGSTKWIEVIVEQVKASKQNVSKQTLTLLCICLNSSTLICVCIAPKERERET